MTDAEKEMIDHWDRVSFQVLQAADFYKTTPQYIIEEFCVDSDFPTLPELED